MLGNIYFNIASANNLEIRFRPERPLVNESFEMEVIVPLETNDEPYISFDPGELVVEGRRKGGVSFSTQLINGQFSSKKTITFIYELRAVRSGTFYLRDFKVAVGNKTFKENNVRIVALKEAEKPKDYFLEAIPSKEKVYKGEGFNVDYYLYHRVPIYNQELKEYPKLNGFLKRFKNADESPGRVERGGIIYQRSKKYSARLFAEKTGELTIDPLKIQIAVGFGNTSFGAFGMRDMRNVILASAPVAILVSEPPLEGLDDKFTGLIGEHKFNLTMGKTKYLVNEPIELKLEIQGPGLLEKMDDPIFFSNPDLETFDTRSEIQEITPELSRKVIEYTYLPRAGMNFEARKMQLSVFMPQENAYKTIDIEIPALEVIGGLANQGTAKPQQPIVQVQDDLKVTPKPSSIPQTLNAVSPFGGSVETHLKAWLTHIILILGLLVFIIAGLSNIERRPDNLKALLWLNYKKNLARGVDYRGLIGFVGEVIPEAQMNFEQAIENAPLPEDVRLYFIDLVKELRRSTFTAGSDPKKISPKTKMFKKFVKSMT